MKNTLISSLMIGALSMAAGPASARTVDLCAGATTMDLPDGTSVPMWGYAEANAGDSATGCFNQPTFPGPQIDVPDTDTTLTITLYNALPEPTSIVIPGLPMPDSGVVGPEGNGPTWDFGSAGGRTDPAQRVRSFGAETAAAGGTETYRWTDVRPGTFIYHSGTHPQKQVYMGLYGAMIQNFAEAGAGPAEAYDGVEYFNEVVLFYSEIDTDQNNAVAGLTHETSIHYQADWFLVNGAPYSKACGTDALTAGDPPTPGADGYDDASGYLCTAMDLAEILPIDTGSNGALLADQKTLIRFLSTAGETHVPTIQGMHMSIHAEDGFEYNWQDGAAKMANAPRQQYSVMMPPLKTKDVIIRAPADGEYAIYDGNGYMTNPSDSADPWVSDPVGGMLRFLSFAPASTEDLDPIADPNGPYSGLTGVPVVFDGTSSTDDGTIVRYDWDFGDGSASVDDAGPTPSHTYSTASTPGTPYVVTLTVTDDGDNTNTNTADVTIVVNQAPTADPNGPYLGSPGIPVAFDGTGSSDPDGTIVSYDWDFGDTNTGTGATPSHAYATDAIYTVTLTVTDDGGLSTVSATTTATIAANVLPIASPNGPYSGETGTAILFDSTGSSDSDGTIVSYEWDFDEDGETDAIGPTPSFVYTAAGTYDVTLTVTDNAGGSDAASTTATITAANQAPIAEANGPYTASTVLDLGSGIATVDFESTGSTDTDGTIDSYEWDFGDGSPVDSTPNPSYTYAAASTYVATLTVTDNEGATGTDTAVVYVVDNQAPVANNDSYGWNPSDGDFTFDPTGNDTDFEDDMDGIPLDPGTIVITSQPSRGDATVVPGGILYEPQGNRTGLITLTYTVDDSDGATSNEATVTINLAR